MWDRLFSLFPFTKKCDDDEYEEECVEDWKEYLQRCKAQFDYRLQHPMKSSINKRDLTFLNVLGEGAFGKVTLVKTKEKSHFYAAKVINKTALQKKMTKGEVDNELKLLRAINFPFAVHLISWFQDKVNHYIILPYIECGNIYIELAKFARFSETLSKFYAAQVLLALEYLHFNDVLFRDLKPENILIDSQGYIKLADFGISKIVQGRTYSMVGTPEYMAPEILLQKGYGKAVDFWSFGIFVYEMNAGVSPFLASDERKLLENIMFGTYTMIPHFSSPLKDLIHNLLQRDLSRRYGNLKNGTTPIKQHVWFKDIKWLPLVNRKIKAPYIPKEH